MKTIVIFVSENKKEIEKAQSILAGAEIIGLPPLLHEINFSENADPEKAAVCMAQAAYTRLHRPCFAIAETVLFGLEVLPSYNAFSAEEFAKIAQGIQPLQDTGILRHALAFTRDGRSCITFVRDSPGKPFAHGRKLSSPTIDDVWVPHGYDEPLSNLKDHRLIHKRHRLYFDLSAHLALPAANDIYEAHVTIEPARPDDASIFKEACRKLGVKAIHIELPDGAVPSHLITASFHRGPFDFVRRETETIARELQAFGLVVTRLKIEAMVRNSLVPETDEDAAARESGNYFEFHVKVPVRTAIELSALKQLCAQRNAHLSRNASNRVNGHIPLHFVTFRVYGQGRNRALASFETLLAELRNLGLPTSNTLREYTIFDTNTALDDGWYPAVPAQYCAHECNLQETGKCLFAYHNKEM